MLSGFGMAMWVTLTTVTFSTLDQRYRIEGAALFALYGLLPAPALVVIAVLHYSQVNYIELRENIRTSTK